MNVEIFADIVCPWCYIGERHFEQARAKLREDIELYVTYRPYQLDPSAPESARPLTEYLRKRFGAAARAMQLHVSQAAASVDIVINWDAALAVNTRTAHRLMRLARIEYDDRTQRALLEALFAAHFTYGIDISNHTDLTGIAADAGMDAERVRTYLATNEGSAALDMELAEARQLGIQGVPAFVIDRTHMIEGAQSAETFMHILRDLRDAAA